MATTWRKGQELAKTHTSGAIACYRVLGMRDGGRRVSLEQLYMAKRFVRFFIDPNEGFRLATPSDHAIAKQRADECNNRDKETND